MFGSSGRHYGITGHLDRPSWGNSYATPSRVPYSRLKGKSTTQEKEVQYPHDFWEPVVPSRKDQSHLSDYPSRNDQSKFSDYSSRKDPSKHSEFSSRNGQMKLSDYGFGDHDSSAYKNRNTSSVPYDLYVDLTDPEVRRSDASRLYDSYEKSGRYKDSLDRSSTYRNHDKLSDSGSDFESSYRVNRSLPSQQLNNYELSRESESSRRVPIHVEHISSDYDRYMDEALGRHSRSDHLPSFKRDYEQDLLDLKLRDEYLSSDDEDVVITLQTKNFNNSSAPGRYSDSGYLDSLRTKGDYSPSEKGDYSSGKEDYSRQNGRPYTASLYCDNNYGYDNQNNNTRSLRSSAVDRKSDLGVDRKSDLGIDRSRSSIDKSLRRSTRNKDHLIDLSEPSERSYPNTARVQGHTRSYGLDLADIDAEITSSCHVAPPGSEKMTSSFNVLPSTSNNRKIEEDSLSDEEVYTLEQKYPKFPHSKMEKSSTFPPDRKSKFSNESDQDIPDILESVEQFYALQRSRNVANSGKGQGQTTNKRDQEEIDAQIAASYNLVQDIDRKSITDDKDYYSLKVNLPEKETKSSKIGVQSTSRLSSSPTEDKHELPGVLDSYADFYKHTDRSLRSSSEIKSKPVIQKLTPPPSYPAYNIIRQVLKEFDGEIDTSKEMGIASSVP